MQDALYNVGGENLASEGIMKLPTECEYPDAGTFWARGSLNGRTAVIFKTVDRAINIWRAGALTS